MFLSMSHNNFFRLDNRKSFHEFLIKKDGELPSFP